MSDPPLNIPYWASLYPVYTDYAEEYEQAMEAPRLVYRAERFWDWKGLNRSIPFETIAPSSSTSIEMTTLRWSHGRRLSGYQVVYSKRKSSNRAASSRQRFCSI